jgi:hypothetical protein
MENETKKAIAVIAFYGSVMTIAGISAIITTSQERKKRAKIKAEAEAQIKAIFDARDVVLKKIANGDYDRTGYQSIMSDLKFYTMVNRYEK